MQEFSACFFVREGVSRFGSVSHTPFQRGMAEALTGAKTVGIMYLMAIGA